MESRQTNLRSEKIGELKLCIPLSYVSQVTFSEVSDPDL